MYTKKDAIRIVCSAAKKYKENLANKNFLIVFKNRENNKIEYFEVLFLPRNFQHLTGLEYYAKHRSVDFYNKCLKHALCEKDFDKAGNYYIPNTCLLGDIRNFGKSTSQILAILSKPANKSCPTYINIEYLAKGFNPANLKELKNVKIRKKE